MGPSTAGIAAAMSASAGGSATPCYLTEVDTMTRRARELESAFPASWIRQYSLKANDVPAIVSRLEDPSDSGDLSQQSHEEWLFLNRNNLEKTLLREVEEALVRVKEGTYGICQECEEPISPKRLQALPWAKFCVRCQEMLGAMANETN